MNNATTTLVAGLELGSPAFDRAVESGELRWESLSDTERRAVLAEGLDEGDFVLDEDALTECGLDEDTLDALGQARFEFDPELGLVLDVTTGRFVELDEALALAGVHDDVHDDEWTVADLRDLDGREHVEPHGGVEVAELGEDHDGDDLGTTWGVASSSPTSRSEHSLSRGLAWARS